MRGLVMQGLLVELRIGHIKDGVGRRSPQLGIPNGRCVVAVLRWYFVCIVVAYVKLIVGVVRMMSKFVKLYESYDAPLLQAPYLPETIT